MFCFSMQLRIALNAFKSHTIISFIAVLPWSEEGQEPNSARDSASIRGLS